MGCVSDLGYLLYILPYILLWSAFHEVLQSKNQVIYHETRNNVYIHVWLRWIVWFSGLAYKDFHFLYISDYFSPTPIAFSPLSFLTSLSPSLPSLLSLALHVVPHPFSHSLSPFSLLSLFVSLTVSLLSSSFCLFYVSIIVSFLSFISSLFSTFIVILYTMPQATADTHT